MVSATLGHLGLLGLARAGIRLARFVRRGLRESGWLRSAAVDAPVSSHGQPIPWFPYPATSFLAERVPRRARVFEYGSGHSTLWFAGMAASVISVESDPAWAGYVQERARGLGNVTVIYSPPDERYVKAVDGHGPFELVVVDGIKDLRYQCGRAALDQLTPDGVVLWDNSDWPDFQRAFQDYLAPAGFKCLTLRGFGPLGWSEWSFAVLYRQGNCLGL